MPDTPRPAQQPVSQQRAGPDPAGSDQPRAYPNQPAPAADADAHAFEPSDGVDHPGADTQMFRKFVEAGEEPSSATRTRAALIAGGAVLLVLVIIMVLLLQG